MKQYILAMGMVLALLFAGCAGYSTSSSDAMMKKTDSDSVAAKTESAAMMNQSKNSTMMKKDESGKMMKNESGAMMAKAAYMDYDAAKYRQALSDGKVVYLEFYASWCPTCNSYEPRLLSGFERMSADAKYKDVVGFRVNYDTQDDLKREFGIVGQHTHVIIGKDGEVVVKSREIWSSQDLIDNIEKAL
ncbi:MAG: thioredoxin family protein [Candidatus Anstonellaceae archaeon]